MVAQEEVLRWLQAKIAPYGGLKKETDDCEEELVQAACLWSFAVPDWLSEITAKQARPKPFLQELLAASSARYSQAHSQMEQGGSREGVSPSSGQTSAPTHRFDRSLFMAQVQQQQQHARPSSMSHTYPAQAGGSPHASGPWGQSPHLHTWPPPPSLLHLLQEQQLLSQSQMLHQGLTQGLSPTDYPPLPPLTDRQPSGHVTTADFLAALDSRRTPRIPAAKPSEHHRQDHPLEETGAHPVDSRQPAPTRPAPLDPTAHEGAQAIERQQEGSQPRQQEAAGQHDAAGGEAGPSSRREPGPGEEPAPRRAKKGPGGLRPKAVPFKEDEDDRLWAAMAAWARYVASLTTRDRLRAAERKWEWVLQEYSKSGPCRFNAAQLQKKFKNDNTKYRAIQVYNAEQRQAGRPNFWEAEKQDLQAYRMEHRLTSFPLKFREDLYNAINAVQGKRDGARAESPGEEATAGEASPDENTEEKARSIEEPQTGPAPQTGGEGTAAGERRPGKRKRRFPRPAGSAARTSGRANEESATAEQGDERAERREEGRWREEHMALLAQQAEASRLAREMTQRHVDLLQQQVIVQERGTSRLADAISGVSSSLESIGAAMFRRLELEFGVRPKAAEGRASQPEAGAGSAD